MLCFKDPANSKVVIDFSKSKSVAYDVIELVYDYKINAKKNNRGNNQFY
ncbi:MAG: hypothetical protein ABIR15_05575 [Chitinophagaceae bacterium]